jgi:hypothetical protein
MPIEARAVSNHARCCAVAIAIAAPDRWMAAAEVPADDATELVVVCVEMDGVDDSVGIDRWLHRHPSGPLIPSPAAPRVPVYCLVANR